MRAHERRHRYRRPAKPIVCDNSSLENGRIGFTHSAAGASTVSPLAMRYFDPVTKVCPDVT